MASDYFPIYGSGLDQLADQKYRWAGMDYANRNANIGRAAQAQDYWNQGVDRNAQVAYRAAEQDLQLQLQERDRADRLAQIAEANQRRSYEFGANLDYTRGRDRATDAFHQKQLEASVAGRAASIAQKNAELQASIQADSLESAQAAEQAAAQARKLNEFISSKRMDMTFRQKFPEIKTGTPEEAKARRTVADMTPDLWAKLDEPTLKKTIEEFKLTSGLDGFEFDNKIQMLVPSSKNSGPAIADLRREDDNYFGSGAATRTVTAAQPQSSRNYFTPGAMGIPTSTSRPPAIKFNNAQEVKRAVRIGQITPEEAVNVLRTQFGFQ